MELTHITDMENRLIRNLSKGYRQRVGLAQAILGFPETIILDEPMVGLDPQQIIEMRELIRSLAKNHTVILSSHILAEVRELCDLLGGFNDAAFNRIFNVPGAILQLTVTGVFIFLTIQSIEKRRWS